MKIGLSAVWLDHALFTSPDADVSGVEPIYIISNVSVLAET